MQIVKFCLLLWLFFTLFLFTVLLMVLLQIVNLVQVNRFVAVCGPSNCGKTAAIQAAAETLRQSSSLSLPCYVSTTTITLNAMREEQLLGYQDREGCVFSFSDDLML